MMALYIKIDTYSGEKSENSQENCFNKAKNTCKNAL